MSNKVNIEKVESGGVVNIYQGSEGDEKRKTISMAAIDKYSSPLTADVQLSPWGGDMHRVSFLVTNALIGQVVQQNYLTYKDASKAEEIFEQVIGIAEEFKKMAEEGRVHSSILTAKLWERLSHFDDDINSPEAIDLHYRYENPEKQTSLETGVPVGLLTYDHNHFPSHGGIVKQASRKETVGDRLLKFANLIHVKWTKGNIDKECIRMYCKTASPAIGDSRNVRNLKWNALKSVRPVYANLDSKSEDWLRAWLLGNQERVVSAVDSLYSLAFEEIRENEDRDNFDEYDLFIFDADKTLWDSDGPVGEMETPFGRSGEDSLYDSAGRPVVLKPGMRNLLRSLRLRGKDVGLISKSERVNIAYEDQPVLAALRKFEILDYFNEMVTIDGDLPKSIFLSRDSKNKKILFFDDKDGNLMDVLNHSQADVVDISDIEDKLSYFVGLVCEAESKLPYEMTSLEYLKEQKTGNIDDEAYEKSSTSEGISSYIRIDNYPEIVKTMEFNGQMVDFRRDRRPLHYVTHDKNENIIRDANGDPIYMTNEEMEKKGLPFESADMGVFIGDRPIGHASDEWGTTGVWIVEEMQRMGIGSELLSLFHEINPRLAAKPMGQATSAGVSLILSYHDRLVAKAIEEGKYVPQEVLDEHNYLQADFIGDEIPQTELSEASKVSWYKFATGNRYVKKKNRPDKPKGKGEWELDHKKPRWCGGDDSKKNLQWVDKGKHKKKTQDEGSYSKGGEMHQEKEKAKGKKSYQKYQSDAGKAKIEKERGSMSEEEFSALQRKRVNNRWKGKKKKNSSVLGWYRELRMSKKKSDEISPWYRLATREELLSNFKDSYDTIKQKEESNPNRFDVNKLKKKKYKRLLIKEFNIPTYKLNNNSIKFGNDPDGFMNWVIENYDIVSSDHNSILDNNSVDDYRNELISFFNSELERPGEEIINWALRQTENRINYNIPVPYQEGVLYRISNVLHKLIKSNINTEILNRYNLKQLEEYLSKIVPEEKNEDTEEYITPLDSMVVDNDLYELYKPKNKYQLSNLGEDTKWCFRKNCPQNNNLSVSESYIKNHNVNIIYKNKKPFLAVNFSTAEIRDINDDTLYSDDIKNTFKKWFDEITREDLDRGKAYPLLYTEKITREDGDIFLDAINQAIDDGYSYDLLKYNFVKREDGDVFWDLVKKSIDNDNVHFLLINNVITTEEYNRILKNDRVDDTIEENIVVEASDDNWYRQASIKQFKIRLRLKNGMKAETIIFAESYNKALILARGQYEGASILGIKEIIVYNGRK